ncbi:MAG: extracellular solute-binding protein [Patescibacteria group bacterium]
MVIKRLFGAGLAFTLLLTLGAGCFGGGKTASTGGAPVVLDYWRVFDGEDTFDSIIAAYSALHPNVRINYRKLRTEEYETELIRAFAEGRGPDMFSVHNSKLGEMQTLMQPMPAAVTVAYQETVGTLRKETIFVAREQPTLSEKALKQQFVDVVASDVIKPYQASPSVAPANRIYGLPMSVDSLVLFYNKDLLNSAGIAQPPTDWETFQDDVIKLTVLNAEGEVTQAGAALGTTDNVERSVDLLSLLMLQNGTVMTEGNSVAFASVPKGTPEGLFPAIDAAVFYTDFANPTKEVYTWNSDFAGSFEAFANGQAAFFFGYSYHIPYLLAAAPKLNYAVSKIPQIAGGKQVNYANYWVEVVANNSDESDYAWDFLQFATSAEQASKYLTRAGKPTALRGLINSQLNSEELGPFAEQVLTAQSWYRGRDADAMEKALNDFADQILAGNDPEETVNRAAQVVRQTY